MDLNFPDFLNEHGPGSSSSGHSQNQQTQKNQQTQQNQTILGEQEKLAPAHPGSIRETRPFADNESFAFNSPDFDAILQSKLAILDQQHDTTSPLQSSLTNMPQTAFSGFGASGPGKFDSFGSPRMGLSEAAPLDPFHLPRELQGGIGNISSRRPSYAAELFTRSESVYGTDTASQVNAQVAPANKHSLASFAAANNYNKTISQNAGYDSLVDSLGKVNLNTNFSDFQARRPSQLVDFPPVSAQQQFSYGGQYPPQFSQFSPQMHQMQPMQPMRQMPQMPQMQHSQYNGAVHHGTRLGSDLNFANPASKFEGSMQMPPVNANANVNFPMKLENKLMLKNQHILSSTELKDLYSSVTRYYQDVEISRDIVKKLKTLSNQEPVKKLVAFLKNHNNLNIHHKMLCSVINKNGKLDLLSYPTNSNLFLQHGDMVIVDGDRGKDLATVLEPLISLNMAILFNFLKKIEHLKSLTITDSHGESSVKNSHWSGTHSTDVDASLIVNSRVNEDNEFILNLPTKQVLRFATPREIQRLSSKFLEEKKAFVTCFNKIKELGLSDDLTLINVEFQFDYKKLIFYYFAHFKRIDFRDLIKESFKIYKTRIWLCAVLPYDKPELYTKKSPGLVDPSIASGRIPQEYDLTTEQVLGFSVDDFRRIPSPTYFHSRNMANLIDNLGEDIKGKFYGFNELSSAAALPDPNGRRPSFPIQPNFNPFGEHKKTVADFFPEPARGA